MGSRSKDTPNPYARGHRFKEPLTRDMPRWFANPRIQTVPIRTRRQTRKRINRRRR